MPKGLVHAMAECCECDWREEDYRTAVKRAHAHHRKTKHKVHIEAGYNWTIGEAKGKP